MSEPSDWQQLKVQLNADWAEHLSDHLTEVGAVSVTFADAADTPIFEPEVGTTPLWQQTQVIALFDAATQLAPLVDQLLNESVWAQTVGLTRSDFQVERLPDQDWERAWMDDFHPMAFGDHLWIVPSGYPTPTQKGVHLYLDPGLAFGTGTHPTTALCLTWLDQNPPQDQTVIDYGCGSGVLALAAKKLGAHWVYGVDIDPQAITASQQNAARNQVQIEFMSTQAAEHLPAHQADCLLANILAGPLTALLPTFQHLLRPQGTLILSGLLNDQAARLIAHYQQQGFECLAHQKQDDWGLLHFRAPREPEATS